MVRWILILIFTALLYFANNLFGNSQKNKNFPAGSALVEVNPGKQPFIKQFSKKDYFKKINDKASDSLKNGNFIDENSDEIDRVLPSISKDRPKKGKKNTGRMTGTTATNTEPDVRSVNRQPSTKLENKLRDINDIHRIPNYRSSDGVQLHDDREIPRSENIRAEEKNSVDSLVEKRKYMKQFVNTPYTWTKWDNNFDDALKALGVSQLKIKLVKKLPLQENLLENEQDDGDWDYDLTMKINRVRHYKFKLGMPLNYTTIDGRNVRSTFNLIEKAVLYEEQTNWANGKKMTNKREYGKENMLLTVKIDGVTTVQTFSVK